MAHENQTMFSLSTKHRKITKAKVEHEAKLVQEWLDKGNKIKVFTRDFNQEDYKLGHVKNAIQVTDSSDKS